MLTKINIIGIWRLAEELKDRATKAEKALKESQGHFANAIDFHYGVLSIKLLSISNISFPSANMFLTG